MANGDVYALILVFITLGLGYALKSKQFWRVKFLQGKLLTNKKNLESKTEEVELRQGSILATRKNQTQNASYLKKLPLL